MRLAALVSSCVLLLSASGLSQGPSPAAAQRGPADPAAVSFGILREDTLLVPFAVYAAGRWSTPWPDANALASNAVLALPKRPPAPLTELPAEWWGATGAVREWELLRATGDRHPVDATGARLAQNQCMSMLALTTGYTSPIVIPRDTYPRPYAGIVSSQRGLLQPIVALARTDAEFQAVRRELPPLFRRYERRLALETNEVQPDRDGGAPRLVAVHVAFLPDGQRLIHFEAERVRRSQEISVIDGWFVRAAGASAITLRDLRASSSDADGKGRSSFTPLASVVLGGRTYWLGSSRGYESEDYDVYDVSDAKSTRIARSVAGGC